MLAIHLGRGEVATDFIQLTIKLMVKVNGSNGRRGGSSWSRIKTGRVSHLRYCLDQVTPTEMLSGLNDNFVCATQILVECLTKISGLFKPRFKLKLLLFRIIHLLKVVISIQTDEIWWTLLNINQRHLVHNTNFSMGAAGAPMMPLQMRTTRTSASFGKTAWETRTLNGHLEKHVVPTDA